MDTGFGVQDITTWSPDYDVEICNTIGEACNVLLRDRRFKGSSPNRDRSAQQLI